MLLLVFVFIHVGFLLLVYENSVDLVFMNNFCRYCISSISPSRVDPKVCPLIFHLMPAITFKIVVVLLIFIGLALVSP